MERPANEPWESAHCSRCAQLYSYIDNGSCLCILINHRKWLSLYYVPITHLQQLVNKTLLYPIQNLIISRIDRSEQGKIVATGGRENRTIRVPNIKLGDLKCSASYRISQELAASVCVCVSVFKSSSGSPLTTLSWVLPLSLSLSLPLFFFLL